MALAIPLSRVLTLLKELQAPVPAQQPLQGDGGASGRQQSEARSHNWRQ